MRRRRGGAPASLGGASVVGESKKSNSISRSVSVLSRSDTGPGGGTAVESTSVSGGLEWRTCALGSQKTLLVQPAAALKTDDLVLGRYRPLRPLGSGGSASVWLVRDEQSAREVAVKVVPREGKAGARAEREAATAARLRHPRCLRALALARDDRHVYVVYEYVAG